MRLRKLWMYCCLCAVWTVEYCPSAAAAAAPWSAKLSRWRRRYDSRQHRRDDELRGWWMDARDESTFFLWEKEEAMNSHPTEAVARYRASADVWPADVKAGVSRRVVRSETQLWLRRLVAGAEGSDAQAMEMKNSAIFEDSPHRRRRRARSSGGGPSSQDIRDSVIPHLRQYESVLDRSTFLILWYLLSHNMHGSWEDANSLYGQTTAEPTIAVVATTTDATAAPAYAGGGVRHEKNTVAETAEPSLRAVVEAAPSAVGLASSFSASSSLAGGRSKSPGQSTTHRGVCHESFCLNGGTCYVLAGSARCRCSVEFWGRRCHKRQTQEHGDANGRSRTSGQYRDYASWIAGNKK